MEVLKQLKFIETYFATSYAGRLFFCKRYKLFTSPQPEMAVKLDFQNFCCYA